MSRKRYSRRARAKRRIRIGLITAAVLLLLFLLFFGFGIRSCEITGNYHNSDAEISENHRTKDYKTELQELVQRKPNQHIVYELVGESGPDHNKTFAFRVSINGDAAGEGSGRTKKEAEQMAARAALEAMQA